jgi:hypothetical protein
MTRRAVIADNERDRAVTEIADFDTIRGPAGLMEPCAGHAEIWRQMR